MSRHVHTYSKPRKYTIAPNGIMRHQLTGLKLQHKADYNEFQKYYYTYKVMKSLLVGSVEKCYSGTLGEKYTGYVKVPYSPCPWYLG